MAQRGTRPTTISGGPQRAIPDKLYFRIGEVAKLCAVPAYVLRFWEGEFPQLKPNKGGTGQRLYRRRDVEMALRVKTLLYDEGFTIPGARQALKAEQKQKEPQLNLLAMVEDTSSTDARLTDAKLKKLGRLQQEMRELLDLLGPGGPKTTVRSIRSVKTPRVAPAPLTETKHLFD